VDLEILADLTVKDLLLHHRNGFDIEHELKKLNRFRVGLNMPEVALRSGDKLQTLP